VAINKQNPKSVDLVPRIIVVYQPNSVEDIQNALKDIFGPMFETMLKGKLNYHLGNKGQNNFQLEEMNMERKRYTS